MAQRVTLPPGSKIRLSLIAGVAGIVALLALRHAGSDARHPGAPSADEPGPHAAGTHPDPGPDVPPQAQADDAEAPGPVFAAQTVALPTSCVALERAALDNNDDATALAMLCPLAPLSPLAARAVASTIASPYEAAQLLPRLAAHPHWAAVAHFVATTRVPAPHAPQTAPSQPEPGTAPAVASPTGPTPALAPSPAPAGAGANVPIRDVPATALLPPRRPATVGSASTTPPGAEPTSPDPTNPDPTNPDPTSPDPWPDLPPPESAAVSPIDATVVWHAQLARTRLYTKGVTHADRLRAHGFLAKAALQAALALGVGPGHEASPLAQQLTQLGLHHGRMLAQSYWRRRVNGLAPLLPQIEDALLLAVLALQSTPHAGDAARALLERGRVRAYVLTGAHAKRLDERATQRPLAGGAQASTAAVWGITDEIHRWVVHGWVDKAVQAIVATARTPDGPGLATLEQLLLDALTAADRRELVPRVEQRLAPVRASVPPSGVGAVPPSHPPAGRSAEHIADEAAAWLHRALSKDAVFSRRYAATRAMLVLRMRPDAVAVLVERAAASRDDPLAPALPVLLARLNAHDGRRMAHLRLHARALSVLAPPDTVAEAEAGRRIRFAATLRAP